jgi:hypothetical protein
VELRRLNPTAWRSSCFLGCLSLLAGGLQDAGDGSLGLLGLEFLNLSSLAASSSKQAQSQEVAGWHMWASATFESPGKPQGQAGP